MAYLALLTPYDVSKLEEHDKDCRVCLESITLGDVIILSCCKKYIHFWCYCNFMASLVREQCLNCRTPFIYKHVAQHINTAWMENQRSLGLITQQRLRFLQKLTAPIASSFVNYATRIVEQRRSGRVSITTDSHRKKFENACEECYFEEGRRLMKLLDDKETLLATAEWFKALIKEDQERVVQGCVYMDDYSELEYRDANEDRSNWL